MSYKKTKLHRLLQTHSVLLFNKKTNTVAGTGTLLQQSECYIVLTAWHTIKNTNLDFILIHLGINGQQYSMKKEKIWYEESTDIAYIHLNTFEAQIFLNRITPIKLGTEKVRDIVKEKLRCAVCGYPDSKAHLDKGTNLVKAEILLVTTVPIPADRWPSAITDDGKDPGKNFLLKYGAKQGGGFKDQEGELIEPEDPHGLSGAAVWIYDPTTENKENPDYALFGIQTGIYERSQILVGSFIKPLLDQIRKDFPNQDNATYKSNY